MPDYSNGLPIEQFIQALSMQLDRAQTALALKAKAGMPLTFAVKEISIDLRAHIDIQASQVVITPVGHDDAGGSVIHLGLTSITRPMIEENTRELDVEEPTIREVLGDELSEEDERRLEWAGIRTISHLRQLEQQNGVTAIEQISQIPALRLRTALQRASLPRVNQVRLDDDRIRIQGRNLRQERLPNVRIGNQPVRVLESSGRELIVEAPPLISGTLSIETGPGVYVESELPVPEIAAELESQW